MKYFERYFFSVIILLLIISCQTNRKAAIADNMINERTISFEPGPQAIIYKTMDDFFDYVPIIMNAEKTEIISYPAPSDVFLNEIGRAHV